MREARATPPANAAMLPAKGLRSQGRFSAAAQVMREVCKVSGSGPLWCLRADPVFIVGIPRSGTTLTAALGKPVAGAPGGLQDVGRCW